VSITTYQLGVIANPETWESLPSVKVYWPVIFSSGLNTDTPGQLNSKSKITLLNMFDWHGITVPII